MSRHEKLIKRLLTRPTDFEWTEAVSVLKHCGYELIKGAGSSRKFVNRELNSLIMIHEPHPQTVLKDYALKIIITELRERGFVNE